MESGRFGQKKKTALVFIIFLLCVSIGCSSADSLPLGCSSADSLPLNEVNALRAIVKEVGKTYWNSSVDPCSINITWSLTYKDQINCWFIEGSCHVVSIYFKGQDLAGELPKSLAKLKFLNKIDLSRNYFTGTIPKEWTTLSHLEYLSLIVNQLSGPIPTYLGNMNSLTYLSIENNMFSGSVPAELGRLVNLQNLTLNANYLTGHLPKALTNLSNLIDFRISSNDFSGKIPDYFRSWTKLQRLEIQGSGFSGPIPSSLSSLTVLKTLRISDLNGGGSDFPKLGNMANLTYLMLRNCNISGSIPKELTHLSNLKSLDLSFNNLVGPKLPNWKTNFNYLYLTSNFLNESGNYWIENSSSNFDIDLSYNEFNENLLPSSCSDGNRNLYRSSSREMNSSLAVCLRQSFSCSQRRYSLHINCGGNETKVGKTTYAADNETGSPAKFIPIKPEWGFSSSGHFWDVTYNGSYTVSNESVLSVPEEELYTKARISPTSLTYYGRCLAPGNYKVILRFAELQFTNNNSFHRLGRRIFDIYIQEKLFFKDFDIVKAANGSEKAWKVVVKHVSVENTGTLEIRLYYAGKGTTAVPVRGVYGPLISAISVESEFSPPLDKKTKIMIALGSVIFVLLMAYGAFIWRQRRSVPSREEALEGIDLQTSLFTYWQIKAATDNFDPANKIGEGGFGSVYKGTLLDGTYIAVKGLSSKSSQGNREFVTEIGMISGLHHPNLVKLYGCCVQGSQLFLVYEYMVNNNLARALFDEDWPLRLDWPTRQRVCTEIAKGLAFLHEESAIKIIHRDIKATNVLLDENLNAKISDFGLARLREEENTHISTRVAGTIGYMSPEYALWGYLTYKADVYSFGVVALEIVAGRSNMDFVPDEENFCLLDCAVVHQKRGELMSLLDPKLGNEYNKEEVVRMIDIALLCTSPAPALRPTMSQVVRMLQGDISVQDLTSDPDAYTSRPPVSVRHHPLQIEPTSEFLSETQSLINSTSDAPFSGSSS